MCWKFYIVVDRFYTQKELNHLFILRSAYVPDAKLGTVGTKRAPLWGMHPQEL